MAYFLISISNRENLEKCIEYGLAGFTNSINGFWTFEEIKEGDYISFLYGARVFNLYKVINKKAFKNFENLPPWPPVTFSMSGKTYHFPFRLKLKPIRKFNEPMVRAEFSYVAENLLLRGGYRKTHFQADETTFYNVSQMGELYKEEIKKIKLDESQTFVPLITFKKNLQKIPFIFYMHEFTLQSLIKHFLSQTKNLSHFFDCLELKYDPKNFEILGEKALPEGHIDLLIKEKQPQGISRKIIIEVKTGKGNPKNILQIEKYMEELREECVRGVLIAKEVSKRTAEEATDKNIFCFRYYFPNIDITQHYSFDQLLNYIKIEQI